MFGARVRGRRGIGEIKEAFRAGRVLAAGGGREDETKIGMRGGGRPWGREGAGCDCWGRGWFGGMVLDYGFEEV